jgi:outer membrane protein insertion porin family
MEVAASHYTPLWFGHVFSARMQANVVESYGRTSVTPLSERLFAGGMRSIRGYRYRGVGPKARREAAGPDNRDHRMLGGNSRALAGVEYTIPLVTGIRAAAFYDMGNVWEESYTFDFSELASGAGIGLRLDIPGFPMQLDYAWALEPDDELSRTEKFSFGIGYGF